MGKAEFKRPRFGRTKTQPSNQLNLLVIAGFRRHENRDPEYGSAAGEGEI
jgi:hypothetical protein